MQIPRIAATAPYRPPPSGDEAPPALGAPATPPLGPNAFSVAEAQRLLDLKKVPVRREEQFSEKRIVTRVFGVPAFVRQVSAAGMTFRHYFGSEEQRSAALRDGVLIAGPMPYVQAGGGSRTSFEDLKGVFLTTPQSTATSVGVAGHEPFIDITLPPGTAVLELEPGHIYLVPGAPGVRPWLRDAYEKWSAGESVPAYLLQTLEKMRARGGPSSGCRVHFAEVP